MPTFSISGRAERAQPAAARPPLGRRSLMFREIKLGKPAARDFPRSRSPIESLFLSLKINNVPTALITTRERDREQREEKGEGETRALLCCVCSLLNGLSVLNILCKVL